jgi:hypothetical protein
MPAAARCLRFIVAYRRTGRDCDGVEVAAPGRAHQRIADHQLTRMIRSAYDVVYSRAAPQMGRPEQQKEMLCYQADSHS